MIRSRKVFLDLLSVTFRMIPLPVLPDTIKSASASPTYLLFCIYFGLLSMKIWSCSFSVLGLFRLRLLFRLCLILWFSTLRPWMLLIYRRMLFFDTAGRCFSCLGILPAMTSGDRSSYRFLSTYSLSSLSSTIFMPWYLLFHLRTYALWSAFLESYMFLTLFIFTSSTIVEIDLFNARAIALRE